MSLDHDHDEPVPKAPLMMMAGIAALSVALAASASIGLVGRDAVRRDHISGFHVPAAGED